MIKVEMDRISSRGNTSKEKRTFRDLTELEHWLFEENQHDSLSWTRRSDGPESLFPNCFGISNNYSDSFLIFRIWNDEGIIFNAHNYTENGRFKRHCSKAMEEWLDDCYARLFAKPVYVD